MVRDKVIEKAKQYLNEEIVACFNCRPWVEDEIVWFNPHTDLFNLLIDYELTDEEWKLLLEGLKCPNCEQPLESRYNEIEIKSEYDHNVEHILQKIENEEILEKLYSFNRFLSKYPYLGLSPDNKTGKQILNLVNKGKKYSIDSEIWYRARRINNESRIFSSEEMKAPDPNKVYIKEGRFNHTGQSFLYLSSFEETAFFEIKKGEENICVIQKFQLSNFDNILDLRSNYENIDPDIDLLYWAIIYNGFVVNRPSKMSSWKPEYFIPRFIADVARLYKYNGIIYTSAVNEGDNLVLFNFPDQKVKVLDSPYIFKQANSALSFMG